jgi:hypothetical protein
MRHWIEALLDPAPIEKGNKDRVNTQIQMPPRFDIANAPSVTLPPHSVVLPPHTVGRSTRARSTRSASPSKIATPSRKIATPRKPRTTRSAAKPEIMKAEELFESVKAAVTPSTALQNAIANGATPSDSAASSVNGDAKEVEVAPAVRTEANGEGVKEGTVRIEVQETVETKDNVETTTTNVKIDVPHNHAELPEPEDPAKMIEEAKRMVAEAKKLETGSSADVKSSKRRIEDVLDEEELAAENSSAKKAAYTTEQKLTKEKVTRRALVGLGVMAAIG